MVGYHRGTRSEAELRAWAARLAPQQSQLDADRADFERHVRTWEQRVEEVVNGKAHDLMEALEIVRRAFPCGIMIEGWLPPSSIH
jgi:hypothetical protein